MGYELADTCVLIPGLTQSACAAWVQAWGSIGAIAAAIAIAWWQHRGDKESARRKAQARAEIAGTGLLLIVEPVVGALDAAIEKLRMASSIGSAHLYLEYLADLLSQVPEPTEQDLLALADHDPECARLIIRGKSLTRQGAMALSLLAKQEARPEVRDWVKHPVEVLEKAREQWVKGRGRLEQLVPPERP